MQHKLKPFKVSSGNQEVKVLGTHFNINAYLNEPAIKTTLLEGSVQITSYAKGLVKDNRIIKPGQQALSDQHGIAVNEVNTDMEIAWRDGFFVFDNEDFKNIMRRIERWYDVEVSYQKPPENLKLGGRVSRDRPVSAVLRALELTGKVHFKVEGRRITVI
jgi:transmembrane sensor